jgi:hypothetical protein
MMKFRFGVGAFVLCNMGPQGWKLGRVIALRYREPHWPAGTEAPYQVALEDDHTLIYVPEDDAAYCREATHEDLRIARCMDALAAAPGDLQGGDPEATGVAAVLGCPGGKASIGSTGYRDGRCHGCDGCPRSWSCVELYSEHYRCAARNGLKVTRRAVDLGTVRVGQSLHHPAGDSIPVKEGFLQCPTLVRLPPGVRFTDEGALAGEVRFDPHRGATYRVELVAVSTARWDDAAVGIVRLEITFTVEGNEPPEAFDSDSFAREQQGARTAAGRSLRELGDAWRRWERGELSNRDTCTRMNAELRRLRALLEMHPRLDGGRWWAQLGGYHMNVHKLLENTLFECELYLGHALTFGDAEVRRMAEQNLAGCYQKRLLEAARFLWIDGVEQMMQGQWTTAVETFQLAAAMKDGWGWAVNHGDIWMAEAAARIVHGAELAAGKGASHDEAALWINEAARLLQKSVDRSRESGAFGPEGHPWASEIGTALVSYRNLREAGASTADWLEAFKLRTVFWCAQVLGGAAPFPPRPAPRREDAATLARRLRDLQDAPAGLASRHYA